MKPFLLFIFIITFSIAKAQYTVNGDAIKDNCNCYTLTKSINTQSGSVWNNNKIDLAQSFDFTFNVFLGCSDIGADGMAFVLQPISTSVGGTGSGMGFVGIAPSVGITLDTYQNGNTSDPVYDHIAIQLNGDVNHSSPNTLTPPTPISASNNNVEDCQMHVLQIVWDAALTKLSVYFDGVLRVSASQDFVTNIFAGNSKLYWGFTAATGGENNLQRFCTSLQPNFYFLPTQKKCIGEPVLFNDSTLSFGGILKHYWNFGDGSPIDSLNNSPTHIYNAAGSYTVSLKVLAADSCTAIYNRTIIIGSKPIAHFNILDSCQNEQVHFVDSSYTSVGTITKWYWQLAPATTDSIPNPTLTYNTYGNKNIKLTVTSAEGCTSDTLIKSIYINAQPTIDFTFSDSVCLGSPTLFTNLGTLADGPLTNFEWSYSDSSGFASNAANVSHVFSQPGTHQTSLQINGAAGCKSALLTKDVYVSPNPIAQFSYQTTCQNQAVSFTDSSFATDGQAPTNWWWNFGNGQTSIQQNPQTIYPNAGLQTVKLIVANARGCLSDTLTRQIDVAPKPIADFTVGNILCNNSSLNFTDNSTVTNGQITQWTWITSDTVFSTQPQASSLFTPGPHRVGLLVSSSFGCVADTVFKNFTIKTKPNITLFLKDTCKLAPANFAAMESTTRIGIDTWNWDFGDGTLQTTAQNNSTHIYRQNGTYRVSLVGISSEGCPSDTLIQDITIYGTNAFAGYDTIAAANQPIQLQASGGLSYSWTPSIGLSQTDIANPIATVTQNQTYYLKAFTPEGCASYDTLHIKIYDGPQIYVPTAFTPNHDGINDILKPITVGITTFHYFAVYNRYGQLIFKSNHSGKGWDGRINGKEQNTGTYIWMVSAVDYRGNEIFRKGSVLLIR